MDDLDLSGRSVLLTGAAGFIGARLCRRLLAAGAIVHATSREVRPAGEPGLRWHQLDLADGDAVAEMVGQTKPDALIHLASHVAGSRALELVLPTFHSNLASTVYLLEAAARAEVSRIILAGSLEEATPEEIRAGDASPIPASPYAAAKAAASSYARMFHELYSAPITLARLFMVYGPGQHDLKKLIPYVILSRLKGESIELSSGARPVDWVYVDDVVEGLLRLVVADSVEGETVELGSGDLVTIRRVVEKLYSLVTPGDAPPFGTLPERPFEQVRRARVETTAELLGWYPQTSLDDGLAATVAHYRDELESGRIPAA